MEWISLGTNIHVPILQTYYPSNSEHGPCLIASYTWEKVIHNTRHNHSHFDSQLHLGKGNSQHKTQSFSCGFAFFFFQDSDVWAAMSDEEAINTVSGRTAWKIVGGLIGVSSRNAVKATTLWNQRKLINIQAVDLLAVVHGPVVRDTYKSGVVKRYMCRVA